MENAVVMNGGEGPNSYYMNSKLQKRVIDGAKLLISQSIQEELQVLQKDLRVFSIADMGCSVGPNTFSSVETIVQAVQNKYRTDDQPMPEFFVYFNDHVTNDFNTLFRRLPVVRSYMAAGVPGSFRGRLFPESSLHLIHSANALHLLSKVPEEVLKEDSPAWNKGRITFVLSSTEVVEAFRAQFFRDMQAFLEARYSELVSGGLLLILMTCRQEGTQGSESTILHSIECLGDALADMEAEGLISKGLIDSFNVPDFYPTASEVKEAASKIDHLTIVKERNICLPHPADITPEYILIRNAHMRAGLEGSISNHFGPEAVDELFKRYPEKLEKMFQSRPFTSLLDKRETRLLLVLRKDASFM